MLSEARRADWWIKSPQCESGAKEACIMSIVGKALDTLGKHNHDSSLIGESNESSLLDEHNKNHQWLLVFGGLLPGVSAGGVFQILCKL
jgi:hypothetical protein